MQDDFDNEMGLPDDELAGDSLGDLGDPTLEIEETDVEVSLEAPAGRRGSGGARARKSSSAPRAARIGASKPAKKAAKPTKKAAKARKKASPARKAARSTKKAGRAKKKGAKKTTKKRARAGKKR
jgi:adenylate kinase